MALFVCDVRRGREGWWESLWAGKGVYSSGRCSSKPYVGTRWATTLLAVEISETVDRLGTGEYTRLEEILKKVELDL